MSETSISGTEKQSSCTLQSEEWQDLLDRENKGTATLVNSENVAVTDPDFRSEQEWQDLLDSLKDGTVIPVIGERVVTTGPDNRPLYPQLTHLIANKLEERAKYAAKSDGDDNIVNPSKFIGSLARIRGRWNAPISRAPSLNDVVTAWLQAGGNRYRVYKEIRDVIDKEKFSPGRTLRQLASIKSFKLFITTTFDRLLEQAINQERADQSPSRDATWVFEKDVEKDLEARKDQLLYPTVCYLLGRYDRGDFVACDEDALEFFWYLGRSLDKSTKLALDLKENGLLIIGLNFPDWLVRFFLRITKQGRLSEEKRIAQYLAEKPPVDPSMTLFFQGTRVHIFKGEPTLFVAELAEQWQTQRSQLPEPDRKALPVSPHDPEPRIFISYAREDVEAAKRFRDRLEAHNLACWLDLERLKPGVEWPRELKTQVSEK